MDRPGSWKEGDISRLQSLSARLADHPSDEILHNRITRLLARNRSRDHSYFSSFQPDFYRALELLAYHGQIKFPLLSFYFVRQVKIKLKLGVHREVNAEQVIDASGDLFFHHYLETGINTDYELELWLEALRRRLLFQHRALPPGVSRLVAALAQQCFNNEYLFMDSAGEACIVNEMEERLAHIVRQAGPLPEEAEIQLLIYSLYAPLFKFPEAERLVKIPLTAFSPPLRACIRRTLLEPLKETRLMEGIPSAGRIADKVSRVVRRQYEENPYPRWLALAALPPRALRESLAERFSGLTPFSSSDELSGGYSILVPGCGTGHHSLWLAAANPQSKVTALDLSKRSLAYGKRMAEKLKITNIRFFHGDLLEFSKAGQTFHHIDCVGVLHCLEKPETGWAALKQMTRCGGTIRIAVYSRAARMGVICVRNEFDLSNMPSEPGAMKRFRRKIMSQDQYRLVRENFCTSPDFYSTSALRDLLFHVREKQYTLAEIEQLAALLNLKFLGFRFGDMTMKRRYLERFPDDPYMTNLAHWRQFEKAYTGTLRMFDFWLQNNGDAQ